MGKGIHSQPLKLPPTIYAKNHIPSMVPCNHWREEKKKDSINNKDNTAFYPKKKRKRKSNNNEIKRQYSHWTIILPKIRC